MSDQEEVPRPSTTPVPDPDGPWDPICWFALSYNGYERYGNEPTDTEGGEVLGRLAHHVRDGWERNGHLPENLHELRCVLFLEQRRTGHGFPFDFDVWRGWDNPRSSYTLWINYVRALICQIRRIAGEEIPMPPDVVKPPE